MTPPTSVSDPRATTTRAPGPAGSSVASALRPLLERLFGGPVPVRIRAWDGSTIGPGRGATVVLHSPLALRRLLWSPGELGLCRAYVAGDLDIAGEFFDVLDLRDGLPSAGDGEVQIGFALRDLPHLWRTAQRPT